MKRKLLFLSCLFLILLNACKEDEELKIKAKSIKLNYTELTLVSEQESQLSYTISPSNVSNKTVKWISSNNEIATVNEEGLVKAIKKGIVDIEIKTENNIRAVCKLTIKAKIIEIENISFADQKLNLVQGKTKQLTINIIPENASLKTITYKSANTAIATIDEKGLLTAKKIGEVEITATSNNKKTTTCKVIVTKDIINVSKIIINKGSKFTTTTDEVAFFVDILPKNATDQSISWSVSDEEMGTIDQDGLWIGEKAGTCNIIAKASNGVTATCELTYDHIAVTGMTMKKEITCEIEEEVSLDLVVLPTNASNQYLNTPEISDEEGLLYGNLNNTNTIMGTKAGTYTITLSTEEGDFSQTCTVNVIPKKVEITSLKFTLGKVEIIEKEKLLIEMEILPLTATDKTLIWKSSKPEIATVKTFVNEEDGNTYALIQANAIGITTLTSTTVNGISSTCEVNVTKETILVKTITTNKKEYTIKVGETIDLGVTILPENATNKILNWSFWNKELVSTDKISKITGLTAGSTRFTIKSTDGDYASSDLIKITVTALDKPTGKVELNGKEYTTVTIGDQVWMAENYAYLPNINSLSETSTTEAKSYVYNYNSDNANDAKDTQEYKDYGVLYNYAAAIAYAPEGWHLPTHEEWVIAEIAMGASKEDAEKINSSVREIGNKFKSDSELWGYNKGTNESGMSILPAGTATYNSIDKILNFKEITKKAFIWTSTVDSDFEDWYVSKKFSYGSISSYSYDTRNAYSVRYIKNK